MGSDEYACERRPKNEGELDVCDDLDIEDVGVPGVRMANSWIELAREHTPELVGRVTNLWRMKATDWCLKEGKKTDRLNDRITATGDDTCAVFDMSGDTLKAYCLEDHRLNPGKSVTPQCSEGALGEDVYNEVNVEYCNKNPKEQWCLCHNVVNDKCGDSPDGAGCRNAILDPKLADDAVLGQSSYDKLNGYNHCRRRVCTTNHFVPKNRGACPTNFEACGKTFKLRTMKNSDVVRACVLGRGGTEEDLEMLGDVPDLGEALELQRILTATDENAARRKQQRKKDDTYILASVVFSCFCMMGIIVMASSKRQ
jgi:hypothetical protein